MKADNKTALHFLLNDSEVQCDAPAGLLVLDFLRQRQRLVGTKEGCKEGDCGACVVLIGELHGKHVQYQPVTSCLVPCGELNGKHLVTIEGLNLPELSPVQQAIVDLGATQCGFCTPGIVVSLTGLLLDPTKKPDADGIKYALSGHLCRCTGYRSLKSAGSRLAGCLSENGADRDRVSALVAANAIPAWFTSVPSRLQKLRHPPQSNGRNSKSSFRVGGGTDLYVQRGEDIPDQAVDILNNHSGLEGIRERNGAIEVGAMTTFEAFAASQLIRDVIPGIERYMALNASWQIRNRATLGGNIVNASPIGDMTALLLALETVLTLRRGKKTRTLALKSFYKGYKILAKTDDEVVTHLTFPRPDAQTRIGFEKVSKRKFLDIASVNSGMRIRVVDDHIADLQLTLGGVAPVPLFLNKTCAAAMNEPLESSTVLHILETTQSEIAPISDVRGSAGYKRLLAQQLVLAHFLKLYPDRFKAEAFYEAQ